MSPLHLQKRVQSVHSPKTSCTKDHPRQELCRRSQFQRLEMARPISKYQACCVLCSAWLLDPINGQSGECHGKRLGSLQRDKPPSLQQKYLAILKSTLARTRSSKSKQMHLTCCCMVVKLIKHGNLATDRSLLGTVKAGQ